jgi:hypothetical protein
MIRKIYRFLFFTFYSDETIFFPWKFMLQLKIMCWCFFSPKRRVEKIMSHPFEEITFSHLMPFFFCNFQWIWENKFAGTISDNLMYQIHTRIVRFFIISFSSFFWGKFAWMLVEIYGFLIFYPDIGIEWNGLGFKPTPTKASVFEKSSLIY